MQEIIINGLLVIVIVTAAVFRFAAGPRPDSGMTAKQKKMLGKVEPDTAKPEYIKNIRGLGYLWGKEIVRK